MGLDLVVEACAKPGHEAEWRRFIEQSFADDAISDAEVARFREISIPPHERLDAPRVGYAAAADAWIIQAQRAETPDEQAAALEKFRGYHVVALVESDGVPGYSSGGHYAGADETSFRGAFLPLCSDVLAKAVVEAAWEHKMPEGAVAYGRTLLAAADAATEPPPPSPPKTGFFAKLFGAGPKPAPEPFEEQLNIVRAAGRWYVFWGERGHAIRAWY